MKGLRVALGARHGRNCGASTGSGAAHLSLRRICAIPVTLGVLVLAACGVAETHVPASPAAPEVSGGAAPVAQDCPDRLQSYAPEAKNPLDLPAGSTMAAIKERGRLIAGVSADTYLLGARNPVSGAVEGFDIDQVKQIAKAIFGDENRYQLRIITAAQRLQVLQDHEVDVVARNMTITCDRWTSIAFSAEYYLSGQKILVRKGSDITGLDTLAGHRVCAPTGTSSMDNLIRLAPDAEPVGADNHTGCLVLLQQGDVDAITGDDTVLAGLAAQDPYAVVLDEPAFTEEPYGIGMAPDQVDLVRFVNAVLEREHADGSWEASYQQWLAPTLGKSPSQPTPQYGRTP
jgi:polar amino acid transport system substrate-binding protein